MVTPRTGFAVLLETGGNTSAGCEKDHEKGNRVYEKEPGSPGFGGYDSNPTE